METPTTTPRPVLTIRRNNGHILKTDLTTLGPMLAYYRLRAGLGPSTLATQVLTASSSTIADIESGTRGISTRNLAIRMGVVLKLTPHEMDHFLYVAGYAPIVDWQQFARDILVDLGLGSVYEEQSEALYTARFEAQARLARAATRRTPRGV